MNPSLAAKVPTKRVAQAVWELVVHGSVAGLTGFRGVHALLARTRVRQAASAPGLEPALCEAVNRAISFFPKRVRCLQRSAVTVRMLRKHGIPATFVVGYRPAPFFSHAWVEVNGRVVNDDSGYQRQLTILLRC